MIQGARIVAAAYAVPPEIETVEAVMAREQARIEEALAPLSAGARKKALEGLGLRRVHVCGSKRPYDLAREAAGAALAQSELHGQDVDLILDYSTLPGEESQYSSFAHRLSSDLGAEESLNLSFKAGGCAGLHLALKTALGWMGGDENIQTALLVTGDTPPPGNRSLMPVTIQGDAGSAVIVSRRMIAGPEILSVSALTLGHLHDAIALASVNGRLEIQVDAARIENDVMPLYYLNLLRLVERALEKASLKLSDVDHFIYSNISARDREGFRRMLNQPTLEQTAMPEFGHTFASDLVINYSDLICQGRIHPGQVLLFASVGIGFTWGVTLARA